MRKQLLIATPVPFLMMAWGACSSTPTTPDGGGPDTSVQDVAQQDKKTIPDVGQPETGPTCPTPLTSIDTSQIQWVPPITPSNACTAAQAGQYWADCYSSTATSAACNGFNNSANAACLACLATNSSAAMYGATIDYTGVTYANIAGCIAIEMDNTTSTGCGAKYQAAFQCELLACLSVCPVTDQASFMQFQTCTQSAATGVCASYVEAECNLVDGGLDGAAAANTNCSANDFQGYYDAMSTVFCGDYTPEAGAEAGADAGDAD